MMETALLTVLALINKYKPVIENLFGLASEIKDVLDGEGSEDEKKAEIDAIVARQEAEFDRRVDEARGRLTGTEPE